MNYLKRGILLSILQISFSALFCQNPELTLQTGHSASITTMAFSVDGKYLATAGEDNIIIIWDVKLNKQIKVLKGHHKQITSLHFFHNNYNLISGGKDGLIIYWDINEGTEVQTIQLPGIVSSVAISTNDSCILTVGGFNSVYCWRFTDSLSLGRAIPIWNSTDSFGIINQLQDNPRIKSYYKKTGNSKEFFWKYLKPIPGASSVVFGSNPDEIILSRCVRLFEGYDYFFYADIKVMTLEGVEKLSIPGAANEIFFKKGQLLWSGIPSRIVSYDLVKNKTRFIRPGNYRKFNFIHLSINKNDSVIAAVNSDGKIYLWKINGCFLKTIGNAENNFTFIEFHPLMRNLLYTGNSSGDIYIFDLFKGEMVKKLESGIEPITSLSIDPKGEKLAISESTGDIKIFSFGSRVNKQSFKLHNGNVNGIHLISDSVLVTVGNDNWLNILNLNSGYSTRFRGNHGIKWINTIMNIPLYSVFISSVTLYNFIQKNLTGYPESLKTLAVSSKNTFLACGGAGYNKGFYYRNFAPRLYPIHLYKTDPFQKYGKIGAHYLSINDICFNESENLMASCGKDYLYGNYNLSNKTLTNATISIFLIPLIGIPKGISAIISEKQMYKTYNSLKIYDLESHKISRTFSSSNEITSLCFSPVNDSLLITDNSDNIVIFDYHTNLAKKIATGKDPVIFNSDAQSIFFQDSANTLIHLDLTTGKIINVFKGHSNLITSAKLINEGTRLLTASLDGSSKIWDVKTGKEIVTLISLNESDFIIKTPDYYYYATKNAKKEIGFTFGTKFYPFEQFDLQYNRPDIVLERLGYASDEVIRAFKLAYHKRLQKSGFSEDMFSNDFHLPEIYVSNADSIPPAIGTPTLNIKITAKDNKYKLDRFNVWINDVALFGSKGYSLKEFDTSFFSTSIRLNLSRGENNIRVSCINEKGVESLRETMETTYSPDNQKKPNLYIVAIGASEYADKNWNLTYAAKDAQDVYSLFNEQKAYYAHIYNTILTNKNVSLENIGKIRQTLMNTEVDDQVIIFYAGHGLLDKNLDYFLSTYNINFTDPENGGLTYDALNNLLDSIPAREKLLLIDACHSGELDKDQDTILTPQIPARSDIVFRGAKPRGYSSSASISYNNSFELMKELFSDLRKGTGAIVISSAGGGEYAFEGEQWKNGVFTYSLRLGLMTGLADMNHDNQITVSELQKYILENVMKLTDGKQKPTMRQENIENDFIIWYR